LGPKLKIPTRPKKRGGENNIKKGETFVLIKPTRPNQPKSIKKKEEEKTNKEKKMNKKEKRKKAQPCLKKEENKIRREGKKRK